MSAVNKTPIALVGTLGSGGATVAAGTPQRGTRDMRTAFGGVLTIKITNGATGPTVQCTCNILIAHNSGSTPSAGSAGNDWKTLASFGGGTTNSAVTEQVVNIPMGVMHLEVEFTGNTAQSVTAEAQLSEASSIT